MKKNKIQINKLICDKCEKKIDKGNISGSPYDKILTDKNIQM